jgi:hypothetical protein
MNVKINKVAALAIIGIIACIAIVVVAMAMSSTNSAAKQASDANTGFNQNVGGLHYTLSEFNQLQPGMAQSQAQGILGHGGTMTAQSGVGGVDTEAWSYQNSDGSNIQLMFQCGTLVQKAQAGLQ